MKSKPKYRTNRAKRPPTRTKLTKTADTLASIFVRRVGANREGIVACYTCGAKYPWNKLHCGHYISRLYKYTRWDLDNMRPQCFYCNIRKVGNAFIFRENLVEEIGHVRVVALEQRAKPLFKEKDEWIEKIIADLSTRISGLLIK